MKSKVSAESPLDITARILKYPPAFVAWLKSRGYYGEFWLPREKWRKR
jgi:hypothetical protein